MKGTRHGQREFVLRRSKQLKVSEATIYRFCADHGLTHEDEDAFEDKWLQLMTPKRLKRYILKNRDHLRMAVGQGDIAAFEAKAWQPPRRRGKVVYTDPHGNAFTVRDIAEKLYMTDPNSRATNGIESYMTTVYLRLRNGWTGERLLQPPRETIRPADWSFLTGAYEFERQPHNKLPIGLHNTYRRVLHGHARRALKDILKRMKIECDPAEFDQLLRTIVRNHGWPDPNPTHRGEPWLTPDGNGSFKWAPQGIKGLLSQEPLWGDVVDTQSS